MAYKYTEHAVESRVVVAATYATMLQHSQALGVMKSKSNIHNKPRAQPLTGSADMATTNSEKCRK